MKRKLTSKSGSAKTASSRDHGAARGPNPSGDKTPPLRHEIDCYSQRDVVLLAGIWLSLTEGERFVLVGKKNSEGK